MNNLPNWFAQFSDEQIRTQYARNSEALKQMMDKAQRTGKKVNGYTLEELTKYVARYERLSRA